MLVNIKGMIMIDWVPMRLVFESEKCIEGNTLSLEEVKDKTDPGLKLMTACKLRYRIEQWKTRIQTNIGTAVEYVKENKS